jgi:hypothetical protein
MSRRMLRGIKERAERHAGTLIELTRPAA